MKQILTNATLDTSSHLPLLLYKEKGLTPLATIVKYKQLHPEYLHTTLSYAGRLDPMAEGLLLVLPGELNKKRKEYEAFEKTYEFTMLCGVSTDTYDVLGKIVQTKDILPDLDLLEQQLQKTIDTLPSSFLQPYPPYSSKPIQGKPLFWWARENKLSEITIPTRRVSVMSCVLLSSTLLEKEALKDQIISDISRVSGDFRQKEILEAWEHFFATTPLSHFPLFTFLATCSSGTYIRALCKEFGEQVNIPSLAYSIKRTTIGPYVVENSERLV